MKTFYQDFFIEHDERLYNRDGDEVYILHAEFLRFILSGYCLACKHIYEPYEEEPCKSCKAFGFGFTLREDLKAQLNT